MKQKRSYSLDRVMDAFFSPDPELRREGWRKIFGAKKLPIQSRMATDPYWLEDVVEFYVMARDPAQEGFHVFIVEFGDKEYEAETGFEAEFLTYLTRALKRGVPFKEAWSRAVGLIWDENKVPRIVYELQPDDEPEMELWTKRIVDLGVELNEATQLARKITVLLRQIWLTRDSDFYQEDMLSESDQEDRNILLEKLSSDSAPSTCQRAG